MKKFLNMALALLMVCPVFISCDDDDDTPGDHGQKQYDTASIVAGEYSGKWTKVTSITPPGGETTTSTETLDGTFVFARKDNKVATMSVVAKTDAGVEDINATVNVNVTKFSSGYSYFNEYAKNGFVTKEASAQKLEGIKIGGVISEDNKISSTFSWEYTTTGRKKTKYQYEYTFVGEKNN